MSITARVISLAALVICLTATLHPGEVRAEGGPFLEARGGAVIPTLVETGSGADLSAGWSVGSAVGFQAADWLAAEFTWQITAAGDVDEAAEATDADAREWRQQALLIGARVEPWEPVPDLRFGAVGGIGLVLLDIGLEEAKIADQQAQSFATWFGGRASYALIEGLYVAADMRYLLTLSWQDATASHNELDEFNDLPLLITAGVGYQLDLF